MGLFDRLTSKWRGQVPPGVVRVGKPGTNALPRVVKVTELPAGFVSLTYEGGGSETVDRDTFDYRYTESNLPDPAQGHLADMLCQATHVRVMSAGVMGGKAIRAPVLLDTTEPALLESLRACLVISEDRRSFNHCSCRGGPTLQFFTADAHLANIALQHGQAIRWNAWRHDAMLVDGIRLTQWLRQSGVFPPLLDKLYQNPLHYTGSADHDATSIPLTSAGQQLLLARIMLLRREYPDALKECNAVLAGQPGFGEAYQLRAMVRLGQGNLEASLPDWDKAVALLTGDARARAFNLRATLYLSLDRPVEALEDFSQCIAIMPSSADALNGRGLVHLAFGRLELAQADLDAACTLAPEWTTPVCNRAFLALHQSDWAVALAQSTRAIDAIRAPVSAEQMEDKDVLTRMYLYRSVALEHLGDGVRAGHDRDEATSLDPASRDWRWTEPRFRS